MPEFIYYMIVGQTVQPFLGVSHPALVKLGKLLGIAHFEFDPTLFDPTCELGRIEKLVRGKSIVIHAPYFTDWSYDLSSKSQQDRIEGFIQALNALAARLPIQGVVVHPQVDPTGDEATFLKMVNLIEVPIFLENLPGQSFTEFSRWYFAIKPQIVPEVAMCFDIPHSYLSHGPEQYLDIPSDLQSEIIYIHISQLDGKTDSHMPFFSPGGVVSHRIIKHFIRHQKGVFAINMEIKPTGVKGFVNLVRSFFLLQWAASWPQCLWKWLRAVFLSPVALVYVWQIFHRKKSPSDTPENGL